MPETTPVGAVIVEPRSLFCDAIGVCLTKGGYVTLSQAQNLDEAMRQADSLHPDLMIIGPQLTEESLVVCREMTKRLPALKVILFTAHADEPLFRADAAYAGVAACLRPESTDEECLAVVRKVMAGQQFFSDGILSLAFQPIGLTPREREVLKLMVEGKTDQQIADILNLKLPTVHNHTQRILEKLGVHHRQEAIWRARHRGLI
jgi:DNA-binding NarL/FixJ family response regulator